MLLTETVQLVLNLYKKKLNCEMQDLTMMTTVFVLGFGVCCLHSITACGGTVSQVNGQFNHYL